MVFVFKSPVEAVWKNKEYDVPIIVTKIHLHEDNRLFFSIQGSNTCIPQDEVEFIDESCSFELLEEIEDF